MKELPKIGVIGGMGPEATILLMQKVLKARVAQSDADHIPMIVDNNTAVPSRLAAILTGGSEQPAVVITKMAVMLENYGAKALVMPCNTAHYYAEQIVAAVDIPFLNMITLCGDFLLTRLPAGSRVGILASPAVRRVGLFETTLAELGFTTVYPANEAEILHAITTIKKVGVTKESRAILLATAKELEKKDTHCHLIACSEFSLIDFTSLPGDTPIFDTLDILTRAIIRFAKDFAKTD